MPSRLIAITTLLLCSISFNAAAEELIRTFKGGSSAITAEFDAQAPWILDWRVTGEFSRDVAVDVALFNAGTGAYEGVALHAESAGNGVRMFNESGRFYFRVDATFLNWTLKVVQLTREEAEQYTPKSNHMLDQ